MRKDKDCWFTEDGLMESKSIDEMLKEGKSTTQIAHVIFTKQTFNSEKRARDNMKRWRDNDVIYREDSV